MVGAAVAALWGGAVAEAARPVVAVFGMQESGTRLKQADLDRLTDFIGAALTESGRYEVVPRDEVKAALNRQKADSYKQCYAQSCQIEIGKELAAEKSLAGTVSRFGKSCIVSLKIFDLAKSTQEAAGTADGPCGEDAVFSSVKAALAKLTGRSDPEAGGPGVVAPGIGRPDYGDVDAEIRAAGAKAAQEAAEKDWEKIQRWVGNEKLNPKRRAEILEKYLATIQLSSPHWAEAQAKLQKLRAAVGMVIVPAGEFYMGCNERVDSECSGDEKPGKSIHVGTFRIDITEVTVAAYMRCVNAGDCAISTFKTKSDSKYCNLGYSDRGQHPMNCVNWHGADAYCRWVGKRLPTEKEWEKAARGTDGRKYAWGNAASCKHAVLSFGRHGCGKDSTWPVGSKPAGNSPYGGKDMIGNVWEWTSDWSIRGKARSARGGSWFRSPDAARASTRHRADPYSRMHDFGFRCALSDSFRS